MSRVKCISLWQPYASLMAVNAKPLETRSWNTKVRGNIYIHASLTKQGIADLYSAPAETIKAMEDALGIPMGRWMFELPFGKIIAHGNLVETIPTERALIRFTDQEPFGDYRKGRWAHHYEDLTAIDPIPWRGSQGFFFAELPGATE